MPIEKPIEQSLTTDAPDIQLSTVSPKDKPWDVHRKNCDRVRQLYESGDYLRYAARMKECSQSLEFAPTANDEGSLDLKLKSAHFCRVRQCPVCQWRRSLMWRARFFKAVPKILAAYPKSRFLFLTLTARNCPMSELRVTLNGMNKAWKRLSERKEFPALGWVKSVEVTATWDCYDGSEFVGRHGTTWAKSWEAKHRRSLRMQITDDAHPHFHVMLMVPESYFKKGYLSQAKWTELWQRSLRVDYMPIVHVKAVKPRPGHNGDLAGAIAAGVLETLKYGVKESDLIADRDWLVSLTEQLHNTRSVALGGTLRQFIQDDEPDDLIHSEDNSESPNDSFASLYFGWKERLESYIYRD